MPSEEALKILNLDEVPEEEMTAEIILDVIFI